MLSLLKNLSQKFLAHWTCKCASPTYVVRGRFLACSNCGRPINSNFLQDTLTKPEQGAPK